MSKPEVPEDFVKLFHQFKQLIEVESEFDKLPMSIEKQIDLFREWFFDKWEK